MKYCNKCILPDTRPNLVIGEDGVCNACKSHGVKKDIDWAQREAAFRQVVERAKEHSKGYDCLIPVSGGKDSTWQTVICKEYGLNPLAVTWKTPARTEIGARNLENLIGLGVDHIDYRINPEVEKKFMVESLKKYGSTAVPMHMALFNIPLKIALKFEIPLIVWGENSAFEYGGEDEESRGFRLDANWLNKFGVTHGTTAEDWVGEVLTRKELTPYFGPSSGELEASGILAVFLGYYFEWDPEKSLQVASEHGFEYEDAGARTGYYDYADIDDDFISIHHYIKWFKFGFTRLFDNLSLEIRNSRITRKEALEIVRERGDQAPLSDIQKFCEFTGMKIDTFFKVVERFRNPDVWTQTKDGVWKIDDFIIPDWRW